LKHELAAISAGPTRRRQPAGASPLIGPPAVLEQIANCIPLRRQASLANRPKVHRSSKQARFATGVNGGRLRLGYRNREDSHRG